MLTQDPIGLAGGVNLYAYAGNNPVFYADPFGLCPQYLTGRPCLNPLGGQKLTIRTDKANPRVGQFGWVRNGGTKVHQGVDLLAPRGSTVTAADQGVVVFAGVQKGHGNIVVIAHPGETGKAVSFTAYAHLDSYSVKNGDGVAGGEAIGETGRTGNLTTEPDHLHFEIRTANPPRGKDEDRIDPAPQLPQE